MQRSVVMLQEKKVPFDIEYVDLSNKPDWFLKLAPLGKVDAAFLPALQRLSWANELHPALASFAARPKVHRWWTALAERPSVQKSAVSDLRQRFDKMIGRDRGGYQSVIGAKVSL